ncbi:unnamed protein product [Rhodiola kirilowii]
MANPEGAVMPKPEALWSEADDVAAIGNSKALNAIFYGWDENVFNLIAECEVAKEAWDILRIAYDDPYSETNDGCGKKLGGADGENLRKSVESVTEEVNPSEKVDGFNETIAEVSDHAEKDDDLDRIYKVHVSAVTSSEKSSQAQAVGVEDSAPALNPEAVKEASVQTDEPGDQQRVETVVASMAVSVERQLTSQLLYKMFFRGEKVKADLPNIRDTMMEKNRETHPAGLVGLRRKNAELRCKEVHHNMTGNPQYLINVKPIRKRQFATFGDGGKGQTEAAAKRSLGFDETDMGGLILKVKPYKMPSATKITTDKASNFAPQMLKGYNRIYVGNLAWEVTDDDLRSLFADCSISSIRFGTDKETGEFRGYAHVDFADSLSLTMALKLDQEIVCGRPAKISCAVPPKTAPKPEMVFEPEPSANQDDTSTMDPETTKKKIRRKCYLCSEKGHLSSSCPKAQNQYQKNA